MTDPQIRADDRHRIAAAIERSQQEMSAISHVASLVRLRLLVAPREATGEKHAADGSAVRIPKCRATIIIRQLWVRQRFNRVNDACSLNVFRVLTAISTDHARQIAARLAHAHAHKSMARIGDPGHAHGGSRGLRRDQSSMP
jgi:hypothetical protein